MPKPISYSDFLVEGALKKEEAVSRTVTVEDAKPFRIIPEDIATEQDEKAFWKRLRHYFRTGERPESRNGIFVPALIAPYLRNGNWDTEYPFYLAGEKDTSQSLESLLNTAFDSLFSENEAKVLKLNLTRLWLNFRNAAQNGAIPFVAARDSAIEQLLQLEVHDEEGERFRQHVEQLRNALPEEGYLLRFHHEIPMILLRQKLEQIEWNRNMYKFRIKEKRDALKELLLLDEEKTGTDSHESEFDFASEMISLSKVKELMPGKGSSSIPEERRNRINSLIEIMNSALDQKERHAHLFVNESLKVRYDWKGIFTSSTVTYTRLNDAFNEIEKVFDKNIKAFTRVLVAMRKANLELEGKYDADIHDDYFEHFKWFKLDQEELNIFPPVLFFTASNDLLNEGMAEFSRLMAKNKPVKVIALIDRTVNPTDPDTDWEDASLGFRQELAANALSHRNVHTLQCATDRPHGLLNGIRAGMNSIAPSLMHILVPTPDEDPMISFLKVNAAAAGRYFPYIMYDPHKSNEWGGRFDVMDNSQPERDWPIYPFEHMNPDGNMETMELAFTYADYKAMNLSKVEELFLVPESMANDYLVPVTDYLKLSQNEQTGMVPYIWLIDEENIMVRAALPYMWVASCQERLDFWNFIQELGGLNSYHVKVGTSMAREEWENQKNEEIQQLKTQFENDLTTARRESAGVAMDKLASVLLNLDNISSVTLNNTISKVENKIIKEEDLNPEEPISEEIESAPLEEEEPGEAWIETFRCTSCNDCTDKYPAIFAYNEEKQAYVKDASKGTFEQLVMAAENCPASCIHPGAPLNNAEPNLAELIKRAEKFN